jgi:hypothetical protein
MFPVTSHDFGTVARGEDAEYAFRLENLYVDDVHVAGVRASCTCTTPEVQTPTLTTHQQGAILAKFNTASFLGPRGATLTVTFDKPYFAEVQLQVRGYIRDDVMLNPGSADFGVVNEGSPGAKQIVVSHAGDDDWRIVTARCATPYLSATAAEVSRGGGQVSYRLTVRLDQGAPAGDFAEHVVLGTNDPQEPQLTVPVTGIVEAGVSVSPAPLFMGLVEPGQKVTKQLVVRGRQPFQVRELICDTPGFTVVAEDRAVKEKVHLISVTFEAGRRAGKIEGSIHVGTTVGTPAPAAVYATVVSHVVADRR